MGKIAKYVLEIILGVIFIIGSAAADDTGILSKAKSSRTDVFNATEQGGASPKGHADLIVRASIKISPEGHFLIERKKGAKAGYPFVLNIDGQGILWYAGGKEEEGPLHETRGKRNPEGGRGTKFSLEKKVRVKSGVHQVFFGLPEEGYSKEIRISLDSETQNIIELKPVYRRTHKASTGYVRHFAHGLSKFEVYLNGKAVQ